MDENSMDYVHLTDDKLLGSYPWRDGLNLLNIVLIGIANELPEHDDKYELHRLLSTLLSMELSVDEKLGIMEEEYGISVDDIIREDVMITRKPRTVRNYGSGLRSLDAFRYSTSGG